MEHFQIIIVGGGALDASQKTLQEAGRPGAGHYILKFKQVDKQGFCGNKKGKQWKLLAFSYVSS